MNYISTKLHSHLEETRRNIDEEKLPCVHTYTNTHREFYKCHYNSFMWKFYEMFLAYFRIIASFGIKTSGKAMLSHSSVGRKSNLFFPWWLQHRLSWTIFNTFNFQWGIYIWKALQGSKQNFVAIQTMYSAPKQKILLAFLQIYESNQLEFLRKN